MAVWPLPAENRGMSSVVRFSTLWKKIFQSVENLVPAPRHTVG